MVITQLFPSSKIIDEIELVRSKVFIKGVYKSLGYNIDRISTVVRVGLPIQYLNSDETLCQVVIFTPFLKNGKKARKLTARENASLDLNKWNGWYFLGTKSSLIPLALKHSNLSPSFVETTEDGYYMLSPKVGDEEANQILEIEESLYGRGVRRITTRSSYDFITMLEILLMKGGSVLSFPSLLTENKCSNKEDIFEFYCQVPENYDLNKLNQTVKKIEEGGLPLESFTGYWNFQASNVRVEDLYSRRLIIHAIALLAYKKLSEEYPYLAPFIYDVTIGVYGEIKAPIVSLMQKLKFRDYLIFYFDKLPYDNWTIIPYESKADLIVKRFIYEKFSEFVLAPKTSFAIGHIPYSKGKGKSISKDEGESKGNLVVYGNIGRVDGDDYIEYKQELAELLSLTNSNEEVCVRDCDIENSVCCIRVSQSSTAYDGYNNEKKITPLSLPSVLENNLTPTLKLSPLEEETLLKMDYGLRGYFRVGNVLKGLFSEPPLFILNDKDKNSKTNIEMQVKFILYLLFTSNTNSIEDVPFLNENEREVLEADLRDQLKILNEDMNVWKYAFLEESNSI